MDKQKYRHELKYYINISDRYVLKSKLKHLTKPDENASEDGRYRVRSLYFDDYADAAVQEKLSGVSRREKFRIRFYNGDTSFIRLEKKSKINRMCLKDSARLTRSQCEEILGGEYGCLLASGDPLAAELYAKMRGRNLRPAAIVDYDREAYIFPAGNVRITIDSDIRTGSGVGSFLEPEPPAVLAVDAAILEVKYDGYLPDIIRDIIQIGSRGSTEFSKYVVARMV